MSKQRFFVISNFLVLLLSSVSAHAIDENEKCMQALLEATEECEKGDLAENKVVNIREACFCGPIQGNTPTGSCNSQKNNDSSFFFVRNGKGRTSSATDDGNPVTFIKNIKTALLVLQKISLQYQEPTKIPPKMKDKQGLA